MKRLKEKFDRILDFEIRDLLGRLSPGKRLAVALTLFGTMLLIFISVIGYGLYRIGHDEAMLQMQQIRSITIPDFIQEAPLSDDKYFDQTIPQHSTETYDDTTEE